MWSWMQTMKTDKPKLKRRNQPSLLRKQMEAETEQSKKEKLDHMIEAKVGQALRCFVNEIPTSKKISLWCQMSRPTKAEIDPRLRPYPQMRQ